MRSRACSSAIGAEARRTWSETGAPCSTAFYSGRKPARAGPAGRSCGAVMAPGSATYSSTTAPPSGVYSSTLQLHPRAGSIILSEIMYRHTPHRPHARRLTLRRVERRTPSHARGRRPPAPPAPGNRARCIPFLFAVDRVRLRAYYGSTGLRFHGRIGAAAGLVYCQVLSLWSAFKPRSSSKLKLGRSELFASSLSLHTLSLHTV